MIKKSITQKLEEALSDVRILEKKISDLESELSSYRAKEKKEIQTEQKVNPDDYLERKYNMLFSNLKNNK